MRAGHLRAVAARRSATDVVRDRDTMTRRSRRQRRRLVRFDESVRRLHLRFRRGLIDYLRGGDLPTLLTAPVIYSLIVPFALLDLWVTVFQRVCFPVYGIAPVPRRRYFSLDRHKLAYLNVLEKINCTYCSYVNGLIAYVREVAARTEQYWCPIKHARHVPSPHARYAAFADYGDPADYRWSQPELRSALVRHPRQLRARR
jgi:hypothetical protein